MRQLTEYRALIVDLDGTLYFQKPVRLAMLKQMALHFWRLREFLIVKKYRKLFEAGLTERERLAQLPADAEAVVHEWMIVRPLPYIAKYRDKTLISLLEQAMHSGVTVYVCSDYPVEEKLAALRFKPEKAFSAEDLGCMKPNAAGVQRILSEQDIPAESCLVIGDRQSKDGLLASNLGAKALILSGEKQARYEAFQQLSK